MNEKEIVIPLRLLDVRSKDVDTFAKVYASDEGTVKLVFTFHDVPPETFTGAVASVILAPQAAGDTSLFQTTVAVQDGQVVYYPKKNELAHAGRMAVQVVITKDTKKWTSALGYFDVINNLTNERPVNEVIVEDWERLVDQVHDFQRALQEEETKRQAKFQEILDALEDEGIEKLKGKDGLSAFELAKQDGFDGTLADWLATLKGEQGDSAYQIAQRLTDFPGTERDWLLSLKGEPGYTPQKNVDYFDGEQGPQGLSAYEVAVLTTNFQGSEADWLASLKGDKGQDGISIKGDPGRSAYDIALDHSYYESEADWLASLKGERGDPGETAYERAVATGVAGQLTEKEWLASIGSSDPSIIGDLGSLATETKENLVASINELQAQLAELQAIVAKRPITVQDDAPETPYDSKLWFDVE